MTATILVIDGFGIGAMPDAGALRAADQDSDTLGSLVRWCRTQTRELKVPYMAAMGLALLRPDLELDCARSLGSFHAVARRAGLGYPGADSFAGHQTMMGADMSHVVCCSLEKHMHDVAAALESAGHEVAPLGRGGVLLVDDDIMVHDNLEADPGLNWNVSASQGKATWEQVLAVSRVVREIAPVARVIAVWGRADGPLVDFVRAGSGGVVGLDTPATGFYRNGELRVEHIGVEVAHARQLPEAAARAGRRVALVGKASDILTTDVDVTRLPGVSTAQNLENTLTAMSSHDLIVANVQETDLSGHEQDPRHYVELLEEVDRSVAALLGNLREDDVLVVCADHGNDPGIGHAFHTREFVPVLAVEVGDGGVRRGADLDSLADVGASIAVRLGLDQGTLQNGAAIDLMSS